jgi:hypothetical protein
MGLALRLRKIVSGKDNTTCDGISGRAIIRIELGKSPYIKPVKHEIKSLGCCELKN